MTLDTDSRALVQGIPPGANALHVNHMPVDPEEVRAELCLYSAVAVQNARLCPFLKDVGASPL